MPQWILPDTRAVFFDAVGTLLYPNPPAPTAYAEAAARHGLRLPPAAAKARFVEAFKTQELIDEAAGWVTSEERERDRWRVIVGTTLRGVRDPEACFRELFDYFAQPTAWRLGPDAESLIPELLDRGLVVGLGSNYDARLLSVMAGFPVLAPLQERTVISAAVGHRKPSARFFSEVVRAAGCAPDQVLFVGDDVGNDYTGATSAGLRAVLYDETKDYPGLVNRIKSLAELTG